MILQLWQKKAHVLDDEEDEEVDTEEDIEEQK